MSQYDSDEEVLYESGSETSYDDMMSGDATDSQPNEVAASASQLEEEYPYTVLSTDQVNSLMGDTIKEVNLVVQVRLSDCLDLLMFIFKRVFFSCHRRRLAFC